ncbi:histidine-type phosphatase [Novosphingobium sp.]|uniref:histidine-type phosphatase n=1 Tax=Novosphingobium sp. TaxID=1874826 RepID=UPI0031E167F0
MKASALAALLALCLAGGSSAAQAKTGKGPDFVVERAVLVMRHGIRAPLAGEVPDATRTDLPWPQWPVAESRITPHGVRALEIIGGADRRLLARRGLITATGCPESGAIRIRTNSSTRTIASGEAYAQGFAPGCPLPIMHRPLGEADPMFEPLRARATAFDTKAAIAAINQETGGMAALVRRHQSALANLNRVLGCRGTAAGCADNGVPGLAPSADGRDLVLTGPIRATSGIAQVLLLEYAEGLSARDVGWGRVDAAGLRRLGELHAALFAVFTKPAYMAAHQSAVLGREVLRGLQEDSPYRLELLMGHDTNVTALAAALRVDLDAPGYAVNDVPPGGGLFFERVRNRRSGKIFVRVSYRTQSPDALRALTSGVSIKALPVLTCRTALCPIEVFQEAFEARLAALR